MKRHVSINDIKINEGQKISCSVCPVHEGISECREVDHIEINSLLLPFFFSYATYMSCYLYMSCSNSHLTLSNVYI